MLMLIMVLTTAHLYTPLLFFIVMSQVCAGVCADRGAPQRPVVPDGADGDSAEGPDAAEQQHSAQTVTAAN